LVAVLGLLPYRVSLVALLAALVALLTTLPGSRAQAQACTTSVRDTKQGIIACAQLHAGLVIVRARHNGTSNFSVWLYTQDPNGQPLAQNHNAYKDAYLIFNQAGRFDGGAVAMLRTDDTYYVSVEAANGPYEITLEQPSPATATSVNQTSFTGKSQQVTPIFRLAAGTMTVTAQSDSDAVQLWLYQIDDLGGGPVPPDNDPSSYEGRLVSYSSGKPYSGSIRVTIPADGLYLFYVEPGGLGSLSWSVAIQ
jgi:hypothetical protein